MPLLLRWGAAAEAGCASRRLGGKQRRQPSTAAAAAPVQAAAAPVEARAAPQPRMGKKKLSWPRFRAAPGSEEALQEARARGGRRRRAGAGEPGGRGA